MGPDAARHDTDASAPRRGAGARLSRTTRLLHWGVGLSVLGMLAGGYWLRGIPGGPDKSALVQVHKSFGMLVLAAALARLIWRIREGLPRPLQSHPPLARRVAVGVHGALIAATLAMPLSGIGRSLAYARPVAVFGWPVIPQMVERKHEPLSVVFSGLHDWLALVLAVGIGLHALAAFKHHLIDRDETLRRMVGWPAGGCGR